MKAAPHKTSKTFQCHAPRAVLLAGGRRRAFLVCASVAAPPLAPSTSTQHVNPKDIQELTANDPEALAVAAGAQRLVRCGPTPLGRGLVAKSALERQTLVSVPLENSLVITDEPLTGISVFGDRWQAQWQELHGQMPQQLQDFLTGEARWDVRMTAWLLYIASELVDSPVWGPYVANLPPADEVTCLLNYGADDARELQVKETIEEARSQWSWATGVHRKYFDSERGELRQLRLASGMRDTLWAMSMVRTRTFSEDVNGEGLTLMVPYADLANHSFRHNSTFCIARDNKRFELRLLGSLGPGEEATISYGESKANDEVMRDYGFVVPGNPNDRINLPEDTREALPYLNGASLLDSIGFKGDWREGTAAPKRTTLEATDGDAEARLVLARRRCAVLSMKLSDGFPPPQKGGGLFGGWGATQSWTSAGRPPPQPLRTSALATERAAVATVRQVYQASLDSLPTSIAVDEQILAAHRSRDVVLSGLTLAAVQYRLEHKRLLAEAVRVLDVYDRWLGDRQLERLGRQV